MQEIWADVPGRVERLRHSYRSRPRGTKVFGAEGHGFELLPPLSEADLAQAESQFEVELPAEYRSFLRIVSAGGAGPYYGLFPLTKDHTGRWGWRGADAELIDVSSLNVSFQPGDVTDALARLEDRKPSPDDGPASNSWLAEFDEILWRPDRTRGAVCLCHEGCGYRDWLVVSGPHRGQIWDDERAGDVDLAPSLATDDTVLTFSSWYLSWLTNAEHILLGP